MMTIHAFEPEAAIIFDWENRWALEDAQGPRNIGMHYERTAKSFYEPFWREGVPGDVIHMEADFSRYKLFVAPMSGAFFQHVEHRGDQKLIAGEIGLHMNHINRYTFPPKRFIKRFGCPFIMISACIMNGRPNRFMNRFGVKVYRLM